MTVYVDYNKKLMELLNLKSKYIVIFDNSYMFGYSLEELKEDIIRERNDQWMATSDILKLAKEIFINFDDNNNILKAIRSIQNAEHCIYISCGYYEIGNGACDFIDDCYNTKFTIGGDSIAEALYNYLSLYIRRETSVYEHEKKAMSDPVDTSYTLTREDCYYPDSFDEMVEDSKRLFTELQETNWSY